jgi:tetratricopeptide (TPR) repeat protein
MTEPMPLSADELERLGDEALAAGELQAALHHYSEARRLVFDMLDPGLMQGTDFDTVSEIADELSRISRKRDDLARATQPPPKPLEEQAADLRAAVDVSMEGGRIVHAAELCIDLGEILAELDDVDGAESAYRQAVALAREVDTAMPELMLWTFRRLIEFLAPSEESITLAQELAANLIEREEMYHPMRAGDAAFHWAVAELKFAEVARHRVDHAIEGVARQAIEMLDEICMHDSGQALQRHVADTLRCVGRDVEADQWQAEADKYEDWSAFMEQQIPGHVHLWDIRIDLSAGAGDE